MEYNPVIAEEDVFSITDDKTAEWAIKIIAQHNAEKARLTELVNDEKAKLAIKEESIKKHYENETNYLKAKLAEYFNALKPEALHTTDTMLKYKLLSGELVYKLPKEVKEYDDDIVIPFLEKNGMADYIKTVASVKKAELNKITKIVNGVVIDENGTVIEGITVVEKPGEFEVKI